MTARDLAVPRPIDLPTPVPAEADLTALDDAKIFAGPAAAADWPAWRETLERWRADATARVGRGDPPGADWAASCYSVRLVWLWDELLYDADRGTFTPERFLAAAEREFGGHDAIVLWHAYPVIGLDPRNQWDFYRDVPGLRELIAVFRDRGLRVFVDYNPWDTGTRRTGRSDPVELAELVGALGADGVFLDTLKNGDPELIAALRGVGRPVALEGESRLPLTAMGEHALSWAQWFADSDVPGVLRAHWFDRRHMLHHIRRWNRDHSAELQSAWMNGCGILVWDVVFGVWVGWNARDAATLRSMVAVQRALHPVLLDGSWIPLAAGDVGAGVFASEFALAGTTLWTVVNRGAEEWRGDLLDEPVLPGERWYDVTARRELVGDDRTVTVPGRGIAGLVRVAAGATPPDGLARLLATPAGPGSADAAFPLRAASRRPVPPAPVPALPVGMAAVRPGPRRLTVRYRRRETGQHDEAPWVDAWKPLPPELHEIVTSTRDVEIGPVAVDEHEVSSAEFAVFVRDTGYRIPLPPGAGDAPVTHVDLADARAYAAWRGARLPTAAEWQAAAEDGVLLRRRPLVWNWTADEWSDGRTRYTYLKGGSAFRAEGSDWYVDGGEQAPDWELKLLLPGGGLGRSECVGFRCAVDL